MARKANRKPAGRRLHPSALAKSRTVRLVLEQLEDRCMLDGALPVISELSLVTDDGSFPDDLVTSDARVQGAVSNDEPVEGAGVEVDWDADGAADLQFIADADGRFVYTPGHLQGGGPVVFNFRSWEWDSATDALAYGPWRELSFTFAPTPNSPPALAELGLARDTGASPSDWITVDPEVTGLAANADGDLSGLLVEADWNNDGVADLTGYTGLDGRFEVVPYVTAFGPVDLRVRVGELAHPFTDSYYLFSDWTSINFDLQPPPNAAVAALQLFNDTGVSPTDNVTSDPAVQAELSVPAGSAALLTVAFDLNQDDTPEAAGYANAQGVVIFTPTTLQPGVVTVRARYQEWDPVNRVFVTSPWQALTFQLLPVTAPQVTRLELLNDTGPSSSDLRTTDPTVTGEVSDPEGVAGREVELDWTGDGISDQMVLTDEAGRFTFLPPGLRPGPVTMRARGRTWDRAQDQYVYGNWLGLSFTLEPLSPRPAAVTELRLLNDTGTPGDDVTTDPTLTGRLELIPGQPANQLVEFDHDSDNVPDGFAAADANGVFIYYPHGLRPGLIEMRARTRVFDIETGDYAYGPWTSLTFTLERQPNVPPAVTELRLLNDTGTPGDNVTTDPTLTGQVQNPDGSAAFLAVEFDFNEDDRVDATAVADEEGRFTLTPEGLPPGGRRVRARAVEWDYLNLENVTGAWTELFFTLEAGPPPPGGPSETESNNASYRAAQEGFGEFNTALGAGGTSSEADLLVGRYRFGAWQAEPAGQPGPSVGAVGGLFTPTVLVGPTNRLVSNNFYLFITGPIAGGSFTLTVTGNYYYNLAVNGTPDSGTFALDTRLHYTYSYVANSVQSGVTESMSQSGRYSFSLHASGTYSYLTADLRAVDGTFDAKEDRSSSFTHTVRSTQTIDEPGLSVSNSHSFSHSASPTYAHYDAGSFWAGLGFSVSSSYTYTANGTGSFKRDEFAGYSLSGPALSVGGTSTVNQNGNYSVSLRETATHERNQTESSITGGSMTMTTTRSESLSTGNAASHRFTADGFSYSGNITLNASAAHNVTNQRQQGSFYQRPDEARFTGDFVLDNNASLAYSYTNVGNYALDPSLGRGTSSGEIAYTLTANSSATHHDGGPYEEVDGPVPTSYFQSSFNYDSTADASESYRITENYETVTPEFSVSGSLTYTAANTENLTDDYDGNYYDTDGDYGADGTYSQLEQKAGSATFTDTNNMRLTNSAFSIGASFSLTNTHTTGEDFYQGGGFYLNSTVNHPSGSSSYNQRASTTYSMKFDGGYSTSEGPRVSASFTSRQSGNTTLSYVDTGDYRNEPPPNPPDTSVSGYLTQIRGGSDTVNFWSTGSHLVTHPFGSESGSFTTSESATYTSSYNLTNASYVKSSDANTLSGPFTKTHSENSSDWSTKAGNYSYAFFSGSLSGNGAGYRSLGHTVSYTNRGTLREDGSLTSITGGSHTMQETVDASTSASDSGTFSIGQQGVSSNWLRTSFSAQETSTSHSELDDTGNYTSLPNSPTSSGTLSQTRTPTSSYERKVTLEFEASLPATSTGGSGTYIATGSNSVTAQAVDGYDRNDSTITVRGAETEHQRLTNTTHFDAKGGLKVNFAGTVREYYFENVNDSSASASATQTTSHTIQGSYGAGDFPYAGGYTENARSERGNDTEDTSRSESNFFTSRSNYTVNRPGLFTDRRTSRTERGSLTASGNETTTGFVQDFNGPRHSSGTFRSDMTTTQSADFSASYTDSRQLVGGFTKTTNVKTGWEKSRFTDAVTNGQFKLGGAPPPSPGGGESPRSESAQETSTLDMETLAEANGTKKTKIKNGRYSYALDHEDHDFTKESGYISDTSNYTRDPSATIDTRDGIYRKTETARRVYSHKEVIDATNGEAPFAEMNWGGGAHSPELEAIPIVNWGPTTTDTTAKHSESARATETLSYSETINYHADGGSAWVLGKPPRALGDTYNGSFSSDSSKITHYEFKDNSRSDTRGPYGSGSRTYVGDGSLDKDFSSRETGTYNQSPSGVLTTEGDILAHHDRMGYEAHFKVNSSHNFSWSTADSSTSDSGTYNKKGSTTQIHVLLKSGKYRVVNEGGQDYGKRTTGNDKLSDLKIWSSNSDQNRDIAYSSPGGGVVWHRDGWGTDFYRVAEAQTTTYTSTPVTIDATTNFRMNEDYAYEGGYNRHGQSWGGGNVTSYTGWGHYKLTIRVNQNGVMTNGLMTTVSYTSVQTGFDRGHYREVQNGQEVVNQTWDNDLGARTTSTYDANAIDWSQVLDWVQLAVDAASLFDPTGALAVASIGISLSRGEDVTLLAVMGAIPIVGKGAKIVSLSSKAGKIVKTVAKSVDKLSKGAQAGVALYGAKQGAENIARGVEQIAEGNTERGIYNVLRGGVTLFGSYRALQHLAAPQKANVVPQCNSRRGEGPRCFTAETLVVVEVGDEDGAAQMQELKRLLASGEAVLERGPLSAEAAGLLSRAADLSEIAAVAEWQRRSMGALFLAIGCAGGCWFGLRVRRRTRPDAWAEPSVFDANEDTDGSEAEDVVERLRRRFGLVPLAV